MKQIRNKISLILLFVSSLITVSAQSLQRPCIWMTEDEKEEVLLKIENYTWAKSLVDQLHSKVDVKVAAHQSSPTSILNTIPEFAVNDASSESDASSLAGGHYNVLSQASYAGVLYYITEDEKYAQYAADILAYYIDVLSARSVSNTSICGNYFYDPRTTYPHFAIAYDFIYNFLKKPETKVYNKATDLYVLFDHTKAQKAIANIAGNALNEAGGYDTHGKTISNHPVLTSPGALFPILCIEDDTERERLFNVFWEIGTKRQNSFSKTILPMFGEQGIWPESVSYGFMPNITMILNAVDRIKPALNVAGQNKNILNGNFLFDNLRNPNRRFVRYGDSHRDNDGTGNLYQYTLNLAERRGYEEIAQQAKVALKQSYDAKGGFKPSISTSKFDNYGPYSTLFWGIQIPDTIAGEIDFQKPTVIIKHAGVALQRNYVDEDNEDYGLCGIIGGAHYVHSHCTGIAMELYGAGYVMAANGGLPNSLAERNVPLHTDYFRIYAGNNTVIVNGTSHGRQSGSWKGNSYLWQNTTVNIAAEPKHLEDPVAVDFNFACQQLNDQINNCLQQRTLSTIRTSSTTGYYFDMFRSKSKSTNKFHDYVYHNLGDAMSMTNMDGVELDVTDTDRYNNDIGDPVNSPGWRFFEDTKASVPTDDAVKLRFDVKFDRKYMHMLWPGGVEKEYTKAVGPPTREAKNGYDKKNTQIIAVRQQGEAWNKPFIAVLEPSGNINSSVRNVTYLKVEEKIVGATVESAVGQKKVTDYIMCNDAADETIELKEEQISFTGRFAIVRKEEQNNTLRYSLYIGEGTELSCYDASLKPEDQSRGFKMVGELDTTYINHDITIEAEDYDEGGEGVAYHDRDAYNYGNAQDYREKGGVDLNADDDVSNGHFVGRIRPGEWLNYTFRVEKGGAYYLGINAANANSDAAVKAYLNDSLIIEELDIKITGNSRFYELSESEKSFLMDSGSHTLRIHVERAEFNFDNIVLRKDLLFNSIAETNTSKTKIFPNPCRDRLNIQPDHNKSVKYTLYNLIGSMVLNGQFVNKTILTFDDALQQGIYFLELVSGNAREVHKVVVE